MEIKNLETKLKENEALLQTFEKYAEAVYKYQTLQKNIYEAMDSLIMEKYGCDKSEVDDIIATAPDIVLDELDAELKSEETVSRWIEEKKHYRKVQDDLIDEIKAILGLPIWKSLPVFDVRLFALAVNYIRQTKDKNFLK